MNVTVKTLALDKVLNDTRAISEIVEALRAGGVVCFPIRGAYRLVADLASEDAVNRLLQSKRRTKNHPALVLVTNLAKAKSVVKGTEWRTTKKLAEKIWPAPLTLVLEPSNDLPPKIKKTLTRSTGKLGVRVPNDALTIAVATQFAGPLLISSANLENKAGASSAAAIRQRFVGKLDLWVDGGDTQAETPSTLVEVTEAAWTVLREGAVPTSDIERAMR